MQKKSNIAKDSIILTIVKCVTMVTGMVQAMLLSRLMTLSEYGAYSQLLIVISIVTTFSALGLANAVNYFYNKGSEFEKGKYVNQIFSITIIVGLIAAFIVFIGRGLIANYYESEKIAPLIIYIAFRPLFANIISLYQTLYISVGKAKVIAARNFIISFLQAATIPISFYLTKSIKVVLIVQLILDVLQIVYFGIDFNKKVLKIRLKLLNTKILKEVLKYALPLGLALILGTLFKESDKLIIGKLMNEEWLAIYTNMSKQLPFEFIASSFTTVVIPVIVKLYSQNDILLLKNVWKNYFQFGYLSTWILCGGAIVCAPEVLRFLYSDKYMIGLGIFIIYLITEMFRFSYFGLILSATGKTKFILLSSAISLAINILLNIVLYYAFGVIGPAIATLLTIFTINLLQLIISCKQLHINIIEIINMKRMGKILVSILISGVICYFIKINLYKLVNNYIVVLLVTYLIFVLVNYIIARKDIKQTLKEMGENKNEG